MNNAKKIFKKIEEAKISPKSRWRFLLKNYTVWVFFGVTVIIGALAFSVLVFLLIDNDWDIYKYLDKNFLSYVLLSLPYFWVIILVAFSFLAYLNYKYTKAGYRISPILIILISVLASALLGGIFFKSGLGEIIDYSFSKNIPYYEKMIMHRQVIWNNPEKGLLAGKITKIDNNNNFYIKSLDNKNWQILGSDIFWRKKIIQNKGEKIKIIGKITGEYVFTATEIRPWTGRGRGIHNNNHFLRQQ